MTVKELIEALAGLPDDMEVKIFENYYADHLSAISECWTEDGAFVLG